MKGFLIFGLLFGFIAPVASDSAVTAEELEVFQQAMDGLLEEISRIMSDETLNREDKLAKLAETADRYFDIPLMARVAIGRKAWNSMTEGLQAEYVSLFQQMVLNGYGSLLLEVWDTVSWRIKRMNLSKKNPGKYRARVEMAVTLKSSPEPVTVQWYWSGGPDAEDLRVYNMSVDGISLLINLQQELRSRLRRDRRNVANFLRWMAERLEGNP